MCRHNGEDASLSIEVHLIDTNLTMIARTHEWLDVAFVDTVIDYIPKRADEVYLSEKSPFFFSDVDFDGEDEFVVNLYKYGTYGSNLYAVYEPDFKLRKDEPFIYLQNEQCVFDSINKTITIAGKDTAYIYQGIGEHFELLENDKGNLSQ